ncbi:hypothetical protein KQI86_14670 [Clostridium sp. MSJ-11]|uniref:ABC-2 family transporter protein n=1 Tax=Clostridium mobile TaxID=2841512 RepID=A0ABS6EMA5_9CLOT|nr:hypothetical protein [Clostridium mobile]MBU5485560.1 hypothetical protein [Clostridium mobile]
MNKKFKKTLQGAFEAPPPMNKAHFLKTLRFPKATYRDFLFSQLHYIRKRVWAVSVLIVFIGWMIAFGAPAFTYQNFESFKIWGISALLPFLAMLTVTEIYRSAAYRMAELEASCRFSLLQIIMARITILGGGNFVILTLLLIFINWVSAYSLLQIIVYLMVPYLVVCGICLWILNRARNQEGVYGCAVAACLVCVISMLFGNVVPNIYANVHLNSWLVIFACCCVFIGIQICKLLKEMEEKQWNLSLIE